MHKKAIHKQLEKYDGWTEADYKKYKESGCKEDGVISFFTLPDDWLVSSVVNTYSEIAQWQCTRNIHSHLSSFAYSIFCLYNFA